MQNIILTDALFIISVVFSIIIFFSPYILKKYVPLFELPSVVTSIGIFGTFLGIVYGLVSFDVGDIQGSVPMLLEGLKFAFLTSIAGIFASIVIKTYPKFYSIKISNDESLDDNERIIKILNELKDNNKYLMQESISQMSSIKNSLVGDGETTLITQLQKIRTTILDGQENLVTEFKRFADKMVEDNTSSLIDALTEVMKDFNAKINEQFGENFKRLNDGVEKLVIWQDNYKTHIELIAKQIEESVQSIQACELALQNITQKSSEFSTVANKLGITIESIKNQTDELKEQLDLYAKLKTDLKDIFPQIETSIDNLVSKFGSTVNKSIEESNKSMELQTQHVNKQLEAMKSTGSLVDQNITEMSNKLNGNVEKMVQKISDNISNQITVMDQELGKELEKVLSSFGSQLTSLSRKFVDDYSQLTEKLQKILDIARNINL